MKNLKRTSLALAALIALAGTGCKDKNNDITLPPIGGYNTSNDVAAANLKSYWSFDGNSTESVSGIAPSTSLRSSYVAGIKGQAVRLDSGYLLYPATASTALNSNIGSASVSVWVYTENQGNGSGPTGVFALTRGTTAQTDWNDGPINVFLENGRPTSYNDTLVLKSTMATWGTGSRLGGDNINDYGVREVDFKTVKGANKWVHYVYRWDGTGSFLDLFANGVLVSNNNFRYKYTGALPGVGFGPLVLPAGTQTQVIIGAFPNNTTGFANSTIQGWQRLYRGNIDQLRVYNKALTQDEITSLYQLELAGR